jgi:hypothetical protein
LNPSDEIRLKLPEYTVIIGVNEHTRDADRNVQSVSDRVVGYRNVGTSDKRTINNRESRIVFDLYLAGYLRAHSATIS